MIPILALVKKDLRLFFSRPLIYVLSGLCCVLWSVFFTFAIVNFVQASFQMSAKAVESGLNLHQQVFGSYLVIVHYLLLFVISAITMKFFAEEKSMKTFPLLLSSPLSSWEIVGAKFIAGAVIVGALLLVSMAYPLSLLLFTDLSWGPFFTSYLGLALVLMLYMASGLLASALTDSSILAVVIAITMNLSLVLMGIGKNFFDSPLWRNVFEFISIDYQYGFFRSGALSLAACVFFLSLIGLFLFLCERVVEFHRWR